MLNSYTQKVISALSALGEKLRQPDAELQQLIATEANHNAWFTPESVAHAVQAIARQLTAQHLTAWLDSYTLPAAHAPKTVGLILAGNIPLVGFHDVICTLIAGHYAQIKASTQDARLILYVLRQLNIIDAELGSHYSVVNKLEGFDAVIATGSNNSSRYFDYYFGKVPHIIRKNRNSVALLTGQETKEQLASLGHDIFDYYGLGCRNVSKLMAPKGYIFDAFFESIESFHTIANHHKYHNNYDYNKAILLVNREPHLDNGFLLLKKDERLTSALAVMHYEEYADLSSAQATLQAQADQIQCVVTQAPVALPGQVVDFGCSQQPGLSDYADGIDTLDFLLKL
ncbi:acyl-CoA reductase [Mucilaginibacter koreensis]